MADDVFSFKQTNSPTTGEMKVASDQMSGGGSGHCGRFQLTLRRVNPSFQSGSETGTVTASYRP